MTSTSDAKKQNRKQQRALTSGSLIVMGFGLSLLLRSGPAYALGTGIATFGAISGSRKGIRPDHAANIYCNEVMECFTGFWNPDVVETATARVVSAVAAQVPLLKSLKQAYTRLSEDPTFFNALVTLDPDSKRFNPLVVAGLPGEGKTRVIQKIVERFMLLNPDGEVLVFDPEYDLNQRDDKGTPWPDHLKLGVHIYNTLGGLNSIRQRLKQRLTTKEATTPLLLVFDEFNNLASFDGMPEAGHEYYPAFIKELKTGYNRAGKRGVMIVTGIQRIGARENKLPLEYLNSFPWLIFPKLAHSPRLQEVLGLETDLKKRYQDALAEVSDVVAMNVSTLHPALYHTPDSTECKIIPHFEGHEIVQVIDPALEWVLKLWKHCGYIIEAIENGEISSRTELADPDKPWQDDIAEALGETKLQRKNTDDRWLALQVYWDQIQSGEFRQAITDASPAVPT